MISTILLIHTDVVNKEKLFQVAEVKLSYSTKIKSSERLKVGSGYEAYCILKSVWDEGIIELIEKFKIILLNRSNRVLGNLNLASGGMASCVIDPKLILVSNQEWCKCYYISPQSS